MSWVDPLNRRREALERARQRAHQQEITQKEYLRQKKRTICNQVDGMVRRLLNNLGEVIYDYVYVTGGHGGYFGWQVSPEPFDIKAPRKFVKKHSVVVNLQVSRFSAYFEVRKQRLFSRYLIEVKTKDISEKELKRALLEIGETFL